MRIGNTEVGRLVLAPMAGVTDMTFRLICREMGADMIYSEMVSAKGIYYNNKNTDALLDVDKRERPVALQLFGEDAAIMAEMAKRIEDRGFDFFDINMGCPVPKVVNNGEGSALMRNPKKAGAIVRAMVQAVGKPVLVKIRKGFNDSEVNAVEMAKILEDNGASAIAIHGRTREQYYSGKADWDIIRQVKEQISIPVIGNGDIFSPYDAEAMMKETGCDAVMIGRGAQGNPWIFSQTKEYFRSGSIPPKPSIDELTDMIIYHARSMCDYHRKKKLREEGWELAAIREMRKHVAWYTAGYPSSASLRNKVNEIETLDGLKELLEIYAEANRQST